MLLHASETPNETFLCFCTRQKHQMKLFHASAHCRKAKKKFFMLLHTAETPNETFSCFCTRQKHQMKLFHASAHDRKAKKKFFMLLYTAERPKRRFPRLAKVISRMVWRFRAWRKSFPERFGISALGESHFPKGLAFPRSAKVISRKVWCFRAWRKSFRNNLFKIVTIKIHK